MSKLREMVKRIIKEEVGNVSDVAIKKRVIRESNQSFKSDNDFERWVKTQKELPDNVIVAGVEYNMDNYDESGKSVTYSGNDGSTLEVNTANRYGANGLKDAKVDSWSY